MTRKKVGGEIEIERMSELHSHLEEGLVRPITKPIKNTTVGFRVCSEGGYNLRCGSVVCSVDLLQGNLSGIADHDQLRMTEKR